MKTNTRLSADLGDPQLLKLLKLEAHERGTSIKEVLVTALESYFASRLENKALHQLGDSLFEEWADPRDGDYDQL